MRETIETSWELWDYDIASRLSKGGSMFDLTDRHCFYRLYPLTLDVLVRDSGLPSQWSSARPTEKQIKDAFGITEDFEITVDGDDTNIFVSRDNGFPIGEMLCSSHWSLSPIHSASPNYYGYDDDLVPA